MRNKIIKKKIKTMQLNIGYESISYPILFCASKEKLIYLNRFNIEVKLVVAQHIKMSQM